MMKNRNLDNKLVPPLRRLGAENFLSFRQTSVPLGALNVLVGPNGSGKTNLLTLIKFLGETARTDLRPAIDKFGGFDRLFFRGSRISRTTRIRIFLEAQITTYSSPTAPDEYALDFWRLKSRQFEVLRRHEKFTLKRVRGPGRRITVAGSKIDVEPVRGRERRREIPLQQESTGLATLRRLGGKTSEPVNDLATVLESFRVFEVDVALARRPIAGDPDPHLESDGSNMPLFLEYLAREHKDIFDLIQEDLGFIVPGIRKIHVTRVGEGAAIEFEESALSGRTPLSAASFGTVRALALLAMLHDPAPPRLSCIEEIDHGFHPYALDRIVERLRLAAERTQILVATHSPALVNRLQAHELIVCERDIETGGSIIPAIDSNIVRQMELRSQLPIGELWFSGTLGGVPNQ